MSNIVLQSYFLIRNVKTSQYLKFTTKTKDQLQMELEIESNCSFYSDGVFAQGFQQAVKINDLSDANRMFLWLNELFPETFEILKVEVNATRVS